MSVQIPSVVCDIAVFYVEKRIKPKTGQKKLNWTEWRDSVIFELWQVWFATAVLIFTYNHNKYLPVRDLSWNTWMVGWLLWNTFNFSPVSCQIHLKFCPDTPNNTISWNHSWYSSIIADNRKKSVSPLHNGKSATNRRDVTARAFAIPV